MKKITIIALSFLLFVSGFSQAQKVKYPTRKGIVQESTMKTDKNGKPKKKALAGVKIFTEAGISNSSDAKGKFTLTPSKAPFKITKVEKNEYTLLSPEQGTRSYYDNNEILDVLMVSTKTLNNYMDSQMEIARLKREAKKNDELKKIEQQKADGKITYGEYFQKQDSINQAYDEQMKRLVEFVERSSKEFFKGMEQIDKEIDECIMKGEYDKADSLLLSKGYFNKRIENIEKLEQVTEQLVKDAVSDCLKYYEISRDKIKYNEALAYLDTARVLQEKHFGLQDLELLNIYNKIGVVYQTKGNLDEALKWYNKVLLNKEIVLDSLSPYIANSYNNVACIFIVKGNYDEAMKLLNKALNIEEQVLDSLDSNLVNSYNNMGSIYLRQGNYDEAMKWIEKAMKIRELVLDSLSPILAESYNNMGMIYSAKKEFEEGLKWYNKALKIYEQVLNPLSPGLASTYGNIGSIYLKKGDYDEALKWYNKALNIKEQVLDSLSPELASTYGNIGIVYNYKGELDEALKYYNKALTIREQVFDSLSKDLSGLYFNIGVLYLEKNEYNKVLEYFNKALPGYIKNYGEDDKSTISLKEIIAKLKKALGE